MWWRIGPGLIGMQLQMHLILISAIVAVACDPGEGAKEAQRSGEKSHPRAAARRDLAIEKNYLGAAIGFLTSHHRYATKVSKAMGKMADGQITLGQLRDVISEARIVMDAAWQGDYLQDGNLRVPPGYEEIDAQIRLSFEMRRAAYTEYLEYWNDQNPAHIESASATFERSEEVAQEAQKQLKERMARLQDSTG